jgi:hypothetical protein
VHLHDSEVSKRRPEILIHEGTRRDTKRHEDRREIHRFHGLKGFPEGFGFNPLLNPENP